MGKMMQLWLQVQQATRAYEAVAAGAWHEANRRFAGEFQDLYRAGQAPSQPQAALKLWLDVANRTLLETHRSEPYLQAQAELLRHSMAFLLGERELVESLVEPAGLPTRTEIDEVHRSVQELKRRVRTLEKAAAVEPAGRPAPARQATTRKTAIEGDAGMIPNPTADTAELMRSCRCLQQQGRGRDHQAECDQGRGRADRDHAQGRGLQERQDDPLPLSADGRAPDRNPGPDRLRPDRPLHDGRSAGGSLADPQPARAGRGSLGGRLGQSSRGDRWLTIDDYVDCTISTSASKSCASQPGLDASTCSASVKAAS